MDAGTPPTAQLPRIFGLPLRHEDLVQKHRLIHCLGGKFLRMLMPESASNFGIALLNDGVAYHGHLLFGLTFNGPWVVDDDRSHTNLLSIFDSAQCSERNQRMEVRDVSPRSFCQLGGQHCDAQRAFEAKMIMQPVYQTCQADVKICQGDGKAEIEWSELSMSIYLSLYLSIYLSIYVTSM